MKKEKKIHPQVFGWYMELQRVFEQEKGKCDWSKYARTIIKGSFLLMFFATPVLIIGIVMQDIGFIVFMSIFIFLAGILPPIIVKRRLKKQTIIYAYNEGLVLHTVLKWDSEGKRGKKQVDTYKGLIAIDWKYIVEVISNEDGGVTLVCNLMIGGDPRKRPEQRIGLFPIERDEFIELVSSFLQEEKTEGFHPTP